MLGRAQARAVPGRDAVGDPICWVMLSHKNEGKNFSVNKTLEGKGRDEFSYK